MQVNLINGDCLVQLKNLADNSIDSIVTDPPYGLSFMGKSWDYEVPSEDIWKECFRVLKHGGHLLAFFGTRTYHRGTIRIEDAGFEIRDQIQWIYASGFPKSHNLKDEWNGWGTALKPANEPIVVARKPLEKGLTVAQNVLKYGTGALNIDGSRIECESRPLRDATAKVNDSNWGTYQGSKAIGETTQGRWPANVIFDEVAAEMLDEQSGVLKSGELKGYKAKESTNIAMSGKNYARSFAKSTKSEGGASRFFYVAKASKSERNRGLEGMPLIESGIKNDSGRGFSETDPHKKIMNQNFHPTVKPIKLMQYLIKLVTPPSGIVLDPFMGSGSTGVAAKELGFSFIGIERDTDYFKIAETRIKNFNPTIEIEESKEDQLEFYAE